MEPDEIEARKHLWQPQANGCRVFAAAMDEAAYDGKVSSVLHSFCLVLAGSAAGASTLSAGMASAVAVPDRGHCGGWRTGVGERDHLPARTGDPGHLTGDQI